MRVRLTVMAHRNATVRARPRSIGPRDARALRACPRRACSPPPLGVAARRLGSGASSDELALKVTPRLRRGAAHRRAAARAVPAPRRARGSPSDADRSSAIDDTPQAGEPVRQRDPRQRRGRRPSTVHGGDRVWLDQHVAGAATRIPAVVGSFPEPFLHGSDGKRLPVRVECDAAARGPARGRRQARRARRRRRAQRDRP